MLIKEINSHKQETLSKLSEYVKAEPDNLYSGNFSQEFSKLLKENYRYEVDHFLTTITLETRKRHGAHIQQFNSKQFITEESITKEIEEWDFIWLGITLDDYTAEVKYYALNLIKGHILGLIPKYINVQSLDDGVYYIKKIQE